jgi:hypothetical protein
MAWSSLAIGSNPKVSMLVDDKPIVGGEDPDGAWRIAVYSCQAAGVAASEELINTAALTRRGAAT